MTWLKDATERALKTAAQFVLVALGGNFVDAWSVDWQLILGAAGAGAFTSVLTSLVSLPIGSGGTASMTKAVEPSTSSDARHARSYGPSGP